MARAPLRALAQLIFMFALLSSQVFAESPATAFDNANRLYEQGKFVEAAAAYEKLIQSRQVSEAIYFNWGNALFKAGQIGRAIGAYQRAERIAPRDPDVRANLQFARNQVQGPTLLPEKLRRWLSKLTLNEWTLLAAVILWVWLLLLGLIQLRPGIKPILKPFAVWGGLLTFVVCGCFAGSFYFDRLAQRAIVVSQETVARQAPLDESQSAFTLHDGAELQIIDQKDQWFQVQADARRVGWVRRDALLLSPAG